MDSAARTRVKLLELGARDTTACIFCGDTPTTKEHIFPVWMHKLMPAREPGKAASFAALQYRDRSEFLHGKMAGDIRDWQIRCVCGGTATSCNAGWMKAIEDAVEPVLTRLIEDDEVRLLPADQARIASWAVLKAMVVHHRSSHHMRRRQLRRTGRPPDGWSVWIGRYVGDDRPNSFVSRPFAVDHPGAGGSGRRVVRYGHATTQVVQHLLLHVVNSPMLDFPQRWRFGLPGGQPLRGNLLRIWPRSETSIQWPLRSLDDRDARAVADGLSEAIQRIGRANPDALRDIPARRLLYG
jgi:hypothetical protein